ncbi:prolipoprotein diacylglyceryl transferase [bacterium]|nr:prolipoprotein diacylglyceryl transferase [bacterium]
MYQLFTVLGIIAGVIVAKMQHIQKPPKEVQLDMYIAGGIGLILGVKIPVFILHGISLSTIIAGKSVMGGLLGTFIAIHIYKFFSKKQGQALGGGFAIPFAVALGFGKIGCYFNGCCGGDFFIPIQLIESASQFIVALGLWMFYQKTKRTDLLFPIYMLSYLIIRFLAEFIRTPEKLFGLLTLYQWLAIIFLPIVCYIILKRIKQDVTDV